MSYLKNLSIKRKLTLIVMASAFFIILVGSSFTTVYFVKTFKENMIRNSLSTIQAMSQDFVKIITIGHAETSVEVAEKLKSFSEVRNAYVYNMNGSHVFGYKKSKEDFMLPPPVKNKSYEFRKQVLHLFHPITYNNYEYGTVYFRLSTTWVHNKIISFIKIVVIFLIGLIGLYFLIHQSF